MFGICPVFMELDDVRMVQLYQVVKDLTNLVLWKETTSIESEYASDRKIVFFYI